MHKESTPIHTNRYNKARQLKASQDEFCSKVLRGENDLGEFPEDLQWEMLVDVLRGKVKVERLLITFAISRVQLATCLGPHSLL